MRPLLKASWPFLFFWRSLSTRLFLLLTSKHLSSRSWLTDRVASFSSLFTLSSAAPKARNSLEPISAVSTRFLKNLEASCRSLIVFVLNPLNGCPGIAKAPPPPPPPPPMPAAPPPVPPAPGKSSWPPVPPAPPKVPRSSRPISIMRTFTRSNPSNSFSVKTVLTLTLFNPSKAFWVLSTRTLTLSKPSSNPFGLKPVSLLLKFKLFINLTCTFSISSSKALAFFSCFISGARFTPAMSPVNVAATARRPASSPTV